MITNAASLTISRRAADAVPGLLPRLAAAGWAVQHVEAGAAIALAGEAATALVIEQADTSALLSDAAPARLRFRADDLDFALALAAAHLRPAGMPAWAEPSSGELYAFAARIAASDASVLVLGETGTGKEGMARFIHAASPRARGSFTAVNCAALPETMLEAILFGHKKGAFTGAGQEGEGLFRAAHGGTLLLDEIAEVPLALQAKLLRALQEKEVLPVGAVKPESVDVRVVACANRDLAAEVAAGRFRADLYWRLNVVPVHLPPLRERRGDVAAIAAALLLRHGGPQVPFLSSDALHKLIAHDWPGNVRELENVIQRALLLRSGERIEAHDIVIDPLPAPATDGTLVEAARTAEFHVIRAALDRAAGNRIHAARQLGISERTLRYRLAEMRAVAA